jgi:hypothetical protein
MPVPTTSPALPPIHFFAQGGWVRISRSKKLDEKSPKPTAKDLSNLRAILPRFKLEWTQPSDRRSSSWRRATQNAMDAIM